MKNRSGTGILLESLFGSCCNCTLRISWAISLCHREISSKRFQGSAQANIQSASMISGGSVSFGQRTGQHSILINEQCRDHRDLTAIAPQQLTRRNDDTKTLTSSPQLKGYCEL